MTFIQKMNNLYHFSLKVKQFLFKNRKNRTYIFYCFLNFHNQSEFTDLYHGYPTFCLAWAALNREELSWVTYI